MNMNEKLLAERAGTMEWEIIGIFDSHEEIGEWLKTSYGITFEEFQKEMLDDGFPDVTKDEWYSENEIRVRPIPNS